MSIPQKHKVQVWIRCDHRFLLLLTKPARGSFWQPVTGKVEAGESLEDAAKREATEETGLTFLDSPQAIGPPFEYEKAGYHFVEQGFALTAAVAPTAVAQGQSLPSVRLDPHEHVDYRWVDA